MSLTSYGKVLPAVVCIRRIFFFCFDFKISSASELKEKNGSISLETRRRMALHAFEIVANYDIAIYNTLSKR
ncbi:MAG: hypothetical protein JRN15_18155, partial [Nitrososphaerota archaeon]|nr:hypothetical protein [Nitrososphaerota archaeon]